MPAPPELYAMDCGFFAAASISSRIVFAGNEGGTITSSALLPIIDTGTRLLSGS